MYHSQLPIFVLGGKLVGATREVCIIQVMFVCSIRGRFSYYYIFCCMVYSVTIAAFAGVAFVGNPFNFIAIKVIVKAFVFNSAVYRRSLDGFRVSPEWIGMQCSTSFVSGPSSVLAQRNGFPGEQVWIHSSRDRPYRRFLGLGHSLRDVMPVLNNAPPKSPRCFWTWILSLRLASQQPRDAFRYLDWRLFAQF
ncbi:hypothetical protein BJX76DRAFT_65565 [Aspergillus varians]